MKKNFLLLFFVILLNPLFAANLSFPVLRNSQDVEIIFPKSARDVKKLEKECLANAKDALNELNAIENPNITFENTILAFDRLMGYCNNRYSIIEVMTLVSTDDDLRDQANKTVQVFESFQTHLFANESKIYQNIKACYETNNADWNSDQIYLAKQFIKGFEESGQSLTDQQKQKLIQLQKEVSELGQAYYSNIQKDSSYFYASANQLEGVSSKTLDALNQNEEGLYRVGCDYPTVSAVLSTCSVRSTRKKLSTLFSQRAYPQNHEVLTQLIEKRDQLANLLGYPSYAHYVLSDNMIKSPEAANTFLKELWENCSIKEANEFAALTKELPQGVILNSNNQIESFDYAYVFDQYKKKHYQVDAEKIAQYFSLENTFNGLMEVYEEFFNIKIQEMPISNLWHEDVKLLAIKEKNDSLIGYVLLDLFPRENKYKHACDVSGLAKRIKSQSGITPGLDVVVANFSKPTPSAPSLLKHSEVTTLFHEFGHALHDLFSSHEYICFGGIGPFIKMDFVELPSQMLENWMWEPSILKKISSHYQTKEPLSSAQIEKLIACKKLDSGRFLQRQCFYSFLSLNYYLEGAHKNIDQLHKDIYTQTCPHFAFLPENKSYASFGHLVGYGPSYYGYMYSLVFASDIFAQIKKEGLLNPKEGQRYRTTILEKGGGRDPNELLLNFLGRSPNQDAFICDLGLDNS